MAWTIQDTDAAIAARYDAGKPYFLAENVLRDSNDQLWGDANDWNASTDVSITNGSAPISRIWDGFTHLETRPQGTQSSLVYRTLFFEFLAPVTFDTIASIVANPRDPGRDGVDSVDLLLADDKSGANLTTIPGVASHLLELTHAVTPIFQAGQQKTISGTGILGLRFVAQFQLAVGFIQVMELALGQRIQLYRNTSWASYSPIDEFTRADAFTSETGIATRYVKSARMRRLALSLEIPESAAASDMRKLNDETENFTKPFFYSANDGRADQAALYLSDAAEFRIDQDGPQRKAVAIEATEQAGVTVGGPLP